MKMSQKIRVVSLEESIDRHIDRVKHIKDNGITEQNDAFIIDLCLQYVILMSEVRTD